MNILEQVTGKRTKLSYADQVYNYIRDQVLSGTLQQGEKIVEEKIAEEFGVSRTPIREALTRLQAAGIVNLKPRSYAEIVKIDQKQASDIAQVRLVLEQSVFRFLCAQRSEEASGKLEEIAHNAMKAIEAENKAEYFKLDSQFHLVAAAYCGNRELAGICLQFDGKVQLLRVAQHVSIDRLELYAKQHFDIVELLKDDRCGAISELLGMHIVHDLAGTNFV